MISQADAGTPTGHRTSHQRPPDARLAADGAGEPYRFPTDRSCAEARRDHDGLGPDQHTGDRVRMAGRIERIRCHGRLSFATLRDPTGTIQLFVDPAVAGSAGHRAFGELGRGDRVGVVGSILTTRRGELSVGVESFARLGRTRHGGSTPEAGPADGPACRPHPDLMTEGAMAALRVRHAVIRAARGYLLERDFTEVQGPLPRGRRVGPQPPTCHDAPGRGPALPGEPAAHLMQLIVAGMERVFDLGRVVPAAETDAGGDPELTMLVACRAYADCHDMMDLAEEMITEVAMAALRTGEAGGGLTVRHGRSDIDLAPPWPRVRLAELVSRWTGESMHPGMPVQQARAVLDRLGLRHEPGWGAGRLMQRVFDERVLPRLTGPLFCLDQPREVCPVARAHREDPRYAESAALIVAGAEVCRVRSEQNDPDEQLAAWQAAADGGGDCGVGEADLVRLRALEQGMPCAGGIGIGIDRLVMLLAGAESVGEVILFPAPGPSPAVAPATAGLVATAGVSAGMGETVPSAGAGAPGPPAPPGPAPAPGRPVREPGAPAVRLLAALTAVGGLLQLLAQVPGAARLGRRAAELGPLWFPLAGRLVTVIVGLLLLLLAGQLGKRKRLAWRVALVLFAVALVGNWLKGHPHPASAYCIGMLIALVWHRDRFTAPGDPPSLLRLARLLPVYLGGLLTFGFAALMFEHSRLEPRLTFGGGLATIFGGLVGVDGPYTYHSRFFAEYFPTALIAMGIAGLVMVVALLFRPLVACHPHTAGDWEQARRLVHAHGWDTLAYFSLRDDKSFFFGSDGEAMIAYTYLGGYALVSGDPVGADESVARVLDEFLAMCEQRAWNPAFLAVREEAVPLYASRGFSSFYLGDEAILDCATFSLDGSARKGLRAAVRRVARTHRFQLIPESAASPLLVGQLNAISARWRGKSPERGFTMSLSQDVSGAGTNPEFLLCVALDQDGVPGGFLRVVPAFGSSPGYTLDLMRHDPDAPNGMTEFLLASTATALGQRGVRRLSMNFAMWGRLFSREVPFTPAQRVARWAVGVLNPFFQIRSLHAFNAKFGPEWLPRVLAYRRLTDLPRVGLLYAGAEGFLALPVIGELLVPKAVGGVSSPSAPRPG